MDGTCEGTGIGMDVDKGTQPWSSLVLLSQVFAPLEPHLEDPALLSYSLYEVSDIGTLDRNSILLPFN